MKDVNIEIAKMRSLMERMEKPMTARQGILNEERHINEASVTKKAVTRDEIVDILDQQDEKGNGGLFATIVYAKAEPVYKTKRTGTWRPNDVNAMLDKTREKYGESDWHKALTDYNVDDVKNSTPNPIGSVMCVEKFQVNWTTRSNFDKAYGKHADALHNLRMSYNIARERDGVLGDNHNQRMDIGGAQANQNGNLSKDFNVATKKTLDSTLYQVDVDGHIVGEIPEEAIKAMKKPYTPPQPEKEIREALSPEEIEAYMKAKAELEKKFMANTLNFSAILAISASVNGTSYYYINDKLELSGKNGFPVDQQKMIEIAEKEIGEKFVPMTGFAQSNM